MSKGVNYINIVYMTDVECVVCYTDYNDNEFSFYCSHPVCLTCYLQLLNPICPYCRQPIIIKRKPIKKLNLRKYTVIRKHLQYKYNLPIKRVNKLLKNKYKLLRMVLREW